MFRKNLTIFMLVGILTTLTVTSTYLMNASAYKPEDPAAKYNCFATDANGNYNLTAEGDLIPCEIDSGDNAWMLTASALGTYYDSWWFGYILWRAVKTKKCCKYIAYGVYDYWNNCCTMGVMGL